MRKGQKHSKKSRKLILKHHKGGMPRVSEWEKAQGQGTYERKSTDNRWKRDLTPEEGIDFSKKLDQEILKELKSHPFHVMNYYFYRVLPGEPKYAYDESTKPIQVMKEWRWYRSLKDWEKSFEQKKLENLHLKDIRIGDKNFEEYLPWVVDCQTDKLLFKPDQDITDFIPVLDDENEDYEDPESFAEGELEILIGG